MPAVTAAAGSPALGGVLLSAWSVTSVLAGVAVLAAARGRGRCTCGMPVLLAAFALLRRGDGAGRAAGSLPVLVVAMLAGGRD